MSGLIALYAPSLDHAALTARLDDLTCALKFRGPDRRGTWFDEKIPFAFGHAAFNIRDLTAAGHQPMRSKTARYIVILDGEISNAGLLREDLQAFDVLFSGRSDAEVLLAAIERWGLNITCQKIRGAFAFALWDTREQRLHLVVDPFGRKTLYAGWYDRHFLVTSDLRFFRDGGALNGQAVSTYLRFGFFPAPLTPYRGVMRMVPGCRMLLDLKALRPGQDIAGLMDPYYRPAAIIGDAIAQRSIVQKMTMQDRLSRFDELLRATILENCNSDIPVALGNGGGCDDVMLATMLDDLEIRYQAAVDQQNRHITPQDIENQISPHDDLSLSVPSNFMITGMGLSQIFLGCNPRRVSRQGWLSWLLPLHRHTSIDAYELNMGGRAAQELAPMTMEEATQNYPLRGSTWWPTGLDASEWSCYADLLHNIPNKLLGRLDENWCAEMRTPFLDPRLLSFIWALPQRARFDVHNDLRILMERYGVPSKMAPQPEIQPVELLRGSLQSWAKNVLLSDQSFPVASTNRQVLWDRFENGDDTVSSALWRLVVVQGWLGQR
jgi:hypothetical protein